jgi:hypothetical protein
MIDGVGQIANLPKTMQTETASFEAVILSPDELMRGSVKRR